MEGVSANIRSVDELQRVVDHVINKAPNVERTDSRGRTKKGVQLFRYDAETGKNVPSSAAGTAEVMKPSKNERRGSTEACKCNVPAGCC